MSPALFDYTGLHTNKSLRLCLRIIFVLYDKYAMRFLSLILESSFLNVSKYWVRNRRPLCASSMVNPCVYLFKTDDNTRIITWNRVWNLKKVKRNANDRVWSRLMLWENVENEVTVSTARVVIIVTFLILIFSFDLVLFTDASGLNVVRGNMNSKQTVIRPTMRPRRCVSVVNNPMYALEFHSMWWYPSCTLRHDGIIQTNCRATR